MGPNLRESRLLAPSGERPHNPAYQIALTLDAEVDGVALGAALRVAGGAAVAARPAPAHPLQHEAPVAHDHPAARVRPQHGALKKMHIIRIIRASSS